MEDNSYQTPIKEMPRHLELFESIMGNQKGLENKKDEIDQIQWSINNEWMPDLIEEQRNFSG